MAITIEGNSRNCLLKLGRALGALLLTALLLCWGGLRMLGTATGTVLILVTCPVIVCEGFVGMRALGKARATFGTVYFCGRIAEAVFYGAAGVLAALDRQAAKDFIFKFDLAILGVVSVPFYYALMKDELLPPWLAVWGVIGYGLFALSAVVEMAGNMPMSLIPVAPGTAFEILAGVYLLAFGFNSVVEPIESNIPLVPVHIDPSTPV